ncbi:MAG TPA: hypothetical protein VGM25_16575 [Caulobacteraceae bacterium]|jgi:hypothetical protein
MPRFYFTVEDGECYADDQGLELPDLMTASSTAMGVLVEHLQTRPGEFWRHDCLQVHLSDESGMTLLTLTVSALFSSAVANHGHGASPAG